MKKKSNSEPKTPTVFALHGAACLELTAAEDGAAPKQATIKIDAYNGGALRVGGFYRPIVIDLAGLRTSQHVPILLDHDASQIVGQSSEVAIGRKSVKLAGVVTGDAEAMGEPAHKVVSHAKKGFRWAASVGVSIDRLESIPEGSTVKVNGGEFAGPLYVVRAGRLGEVSIVAVGADETAATQIAATASNKEVAMTFEEWLQAKGFGDAELTDVQRTALEAAWKAEQAEKEGGKEGNGEGSGDEEPAAPVTASAAKTATVPVEADLTKSRAATAAEYRRVAAIRKICAEGHDEIAAKAIEEGWTTDRTELEVLRARRPKAPAIHVAPDRAVTAQVLEAACLQTARFDDVEKLVDAQVLEVAARQFRSGIGLQELLLEAAWANGYTGRRFRGNHRAVLQFAFGHQVAAGFSTISIGGILSNVVNKSLLKGFMAVERTWRDICRVESVSDFKTITHHRLIGDDEYEEVTPGGEIKHGTLGEQSFQNKADTYGKLLTVSRQDIINDDLGAITTVPRKLGRGSGLKINDVFWKAFLDNAAFFSVGNKNLLSGANSALSINALTAAEVAFMEQTDPNGKPIGIVPVILLVPTPLYATGTVLYKSTEIRDTTASTKYPVANPHTGKYRVAMSRYLNNPTYSGYSDKAWYLLADPEDLPVIEVVFLDGKEEPTIETAEADFDTLGVKFRGFHDFGVGKQDPCGGAKSTGEE